METLARPRRERGFTLLATLLIAAVLGATGSALLQMSVVESRISARRRDRDQLLYVAESGALMVKSWFDRPVAGDPGRSATLRHLFLGRHDLRDPGLFIRSRRTIDHDSDPSTPAIGADGSPGREFYRQGRLVTAGQPHIDLFHKPYRGSVVESLLGSEEGPDLVLEDLPGAIDLLDRLNQELFPRQLSTGRIERIEIYAPPSTPSGRLGVATVKVTAAKHPALVSSGGVLTVPPGSKPVARAVIRMGLAEIPVNAPRGPLESCGDLTALGPMRARWGRVLARGAISLPATLPELDAGVGSAVPYASYGRRIGGLAPGDDLATWLSSPDDSIEDPWLKIISGGDLIGWETLPDHPFPYSLSTPVDSDHSNLFQRNAAADCSALEYRFWKRIARGSKQGMRDVHYYAFDRRTGMFREDGRGPARSVREWTDGKDGIFFFDTLDSAPPRGSNLTPPVSITGGTWSSDGVIYLNAESFFVDGVSGRPRVIYPPGEPFDDADHDGTRDPLEDFVNLRYPTTAGTGTATDEVLKDLIAAQSASVTVEGETHHGSTTMQRDPKGLPIVAPVNLFGVLYNSGDIVLEGDAVHHGSLIAGGEMIQHGSGSPTPTVLFDDGLNAGTWPPADVGIPRTFISFWKVSQ